MKTRLLFILFLSGLSSFAQDKNSAVKFVNPPVIAKPVGYSASVQIDLGNAVMIIIAGQVPLDSLGKLVGKDNFLQQAEQTFTNIRKIVEAAGGNMSDIVKLNYYIRDITNLQVLRTTRDKFVNTKNPPVSTLVEVSKLFRDDVMLEVEATAVIKKN